MERRFDPMTGEPLVQVSENVTENVAEAAAGVNEYTADAQNSVNETYSPVAAPKKPNLVIPAVIGGVALVAVIVVVALLSGVFTSPSKKIAVAWTNTFKEQPNLVKNMLPIAKGLEDGEYGAEVSMDIEGNSVTVRGDVKEKVMQFSGNVKISGMPDIDFLAELNESEVKAQLVDLDDNIFTYNYVEEKDGFLADEMEDELAAVDEMVKFIYNSEEKSKELEKAYTEAALKFYKEMKFEKADKETYEINGKDRKCEGYVTVVDEDMWCDFVDAIEDATMECYEGYFGALAEISGEDADEMLDVYSDAFDDMREGFEELEEMEVTVYIYKKQIACVKLEADGDELEVMFKGCDKGMYNIEVVADGDTEFEIIGSVEGTEEIYSVEAEGEEVLNFVYDYKSGDFSFEIMDGSESAVIEGCIEVTDKTLTIEIDEITADGETQEVNMTIVYETTATMQEFDGEVFDIGNASESELQEVIMDLQKAFY